MDGSTGSRSDDGRLRCRTVHLGLHRGIEVAGLPTFRVPGPGRMRATLSRRRHLTSGRSSADSTGRKSTTRCCARSSTRHDKARVAHARQPRHPARLTAAIGRIEMRARPSTDRRRPPAPRPARRRVRLPACIRASPVARVAGQSRRTAFVLRLNRHVVRDAPARFAARTGPSPRSRKHKVKNAVQYIANFRARRRRSRRAGCGVDGMVCGHIHRARVSARHRRRHLHRGDGDWVESLLGAGRGPPDRAACAWSTGRRRRSHALQR